MARRLITILIYPQVKHNRCYWSFVFLDIMHRAQIFLIDIKFNTRSWVTLDS